MRSYNDLSNEERGELMVRSLQAKARELGWFNAAESKLPTLEYEEHVRNVKAAFELLPESIQAAGKKIWAFAADKQREFERDSREAMDWLLRHGWAPFLQCPFDTTKIIYDEYKMLPFVEAQIVVDKFAIETHSPAVIRKDILGVWKARPQLSSRLAILEAAVEAHIEGKYALSVPAILPQIEGFVVDYVGHKGYLRKGYDAYIAKMLTGGDQDLSRCYRDLIHLNLLAGFHHGRPLNPFINRHSILHGADLSYATQAVSLRAILIFDFLARHAAKINFVALKTQSYYHNTMCPSIANAEGDRRVYTHFFEARDEGLTPCPTCKPQDSF